MKKFSKRRPAALTPADGGVTEFCHSVVPVEGGYEYESVDVIGEPVRTNVKYALMLERYTAEEIDEMENEKRYSEEPEVVAEYQAYIAVKTQCNDLINTTIGEGFE